MRNLVLLLSSGHTVRIALRDGDVTDNNPETFGAHDTREWLSVLPAMRIAPDLDEITFAYVEDTDSLRANDFNRITVVSLRG